MNLNAALLPKSISAMFYAANRLPTTSQDERSRLHWNGGFLRKAVSRIEFFSIRCSAIAAGRVPHINTLNSRPSHQVLLVYTVDQTGHPTTDILAKNGGCPFRWTAHSRPVTLRDNQRDLPKPQ